MKKTIGIIDNYLDIDFKELTERRSVSSLTVLGRYAFIDFSISNLVNAQLQDIVILVKDGTRSLFKHLGSYLTNYHINAKTGNISLFINEVKSPNTDINNLKENLMSLKEIHCDDLIFLFPNYLENLDLSGLIEYHQKEGNDVTFLYYPNYTIDKYRHYFGVDLTNKKLYKPTVGSTGPIFSGIYIIKKHIAVNLINMSAGSASLIDVISKATNLKFGFYEFNGYLRVFSDLQSYHKLSLELLEKSNADLLFDAARPIYTRTFDTPPVLYLENAKVKDSMIANGSIIDGIVEHCIIGRDVQIAKNARVVNSIIFTHTRIGENANIENAVIDKSVLISGDQKVGKKDKIVVIKEGQIV
jgi:glucose-1-phosphate adenylyltransferase